MEKLGLIKWQVKSHKDTKFWRMYYSWNYAIFWKNFWTQVYKNWVVENDKELVMEKDFCSFNILLLKCL